MAAVLSCRFVVQDGCPSSLLQRGLYIRMKDSYDFFYYNACSFNGLQKKLILCSKEETV